MGPLLFSLVLHPLILRLATIKGLDINKWYLDDGVIAGRSRDVKAALDMLLKEGPAIGVFLNEEKCELITHPAAAKCLDIFPPSIALYRRQHVAPRCPDWRRRPLRRLRHGRLVKAGL